MSSGTCSRSRKQRKRTAPFPNTNHRHPLKHPFSLLSKTSTFFSCAIARSRLASAVDFVSPALRGIRLTILGDATSHPESLLGADWRISGGRARKDSLGSPLFGAGLWRRFFLRGTRFFFNLFGSNYAVFRLSSFYLFVCLRYSVTSSLNRGMRFLTIFAASCSPICPGDMNLPLPTCCR